MIIARGRIGDTLNMSTELGIACITIQVEVSFNGASRMSSIEVPVTDEEAKQLHHEFIEKRGQVPVVLYIGKS